MGVRSAPVLLLALTCFIGREANATSITSTTYSQWTKNVTGAVEVFNPPTSGTFNTAAGITFHSTNPAASFVYSGPDNSTWQLTAGFYTSSGHNFLSLFGASDGKGNITITMPTGGENAFLLSLATTASTPITVTLSDGQSFNPAAGVFGLSISHDINWLTVSTTSGSQAVIDDFYFGNSTLTQDVTQQPAPVPENATFALIGGGLLILIGGRRKLFDRVIQ